MLIANQTKKNMLSDVKTCTMWGFIKKFNNKHLMASSKCLIEGIA